MSAVFVSLSDGKLSSLVDASTGRVALAMPAIHMRTAQAIKRAVERLGQENVAVVIDCNEEVFRLGYGKFSGLLHLRNGNCRVKQCAGLRVGALVCDDRAWVFAPTALYVEAEVHSDETPNAVALSGSSVDRILRGIMEVKGGGPPPEIGMEDVSEQEIARTTVALEDAPPIPFNLARQVRVFEPYIQYVEISLRGCAIQRYRLEVPKAIQGLDPGGEMSSRLRTTFELIERYSNVSSKPLEDDLNTIRAHFTRSLGKPWGRVILRAARPRFDERMEAFRERLAEHSRSVEKSLEAQLETSRQQLVNYFLPIAQRRPPDALLGQIGGSPTEEQIRDWLDTELAKVFPEPGVLVSEMRLDLQFRDVTYETLQENGFGERLRSAYPHINWNKPFQEYDAARAREDVSPEMPG